MLCSVSHPFFSMTNLPNFCLYATLPVLSSLLSMQSVFSPPLTMLPFSPLKVVLLDGLVV